jgi:hypothetical protein
MTTEPMTPEEEYEYYADPAHQMPRGPAVRRRPRQRPPLSEPVPIRFPADVLEKARVQAEADHRSLSSWVRLAVERELGLIAR